MVNKDYQKRDGRTDRQTTRDGIGRAYAEHRAAKIILNR